MSPPSSRPPSLQDFEPLLPGERVILQAAANGTIARLSYQRPRSATPELQVRGEFLAFLAHGTSSDALVAGRQLQVMGASVIGPLDLAAAAVPMALWFYRCSFATAPRFVDARLQGSLSFSDCSLPGLRAEALRVDGDLAIQAGSRVAGEIVLTRAMVGRDFDLGRVRIGGDDLRSAPGRLMADGMVVGRDVNFEGGAEAVGEVRFVAARIGGSLRAGGARMTADVDEHGARGVALNLDRVQIGADLILNAGFTAAGTVQLQSARVQGNLDGSNADFDAVGDASWRENGSALRLDRARIGGALILQELQSPLQGASLVDAKVGTLTDDAGSWGQHHALDGFAYTRFGPGAPTDALTRLSWLARQDSAHLTLDYRPDPWRRLVRALRRGGHAHSAASVAIGRERHLRDIGRVGRGMPQPLRWAARLAHVSWGGVAGYGHRPLRILMAAAVVWLACGGAYWAATQGPGMATTDGAEAHAMLGCSVPCRPGVDGADFAHPFVLSLQALLPFAHVNQLLQGVGAARLDTENGRALPLGLLLWIEAACGWALAALAVASVLKLGNRDRD